MVLTYDITVHHLFCLDSLKLNPMTAPPLPGSQTNLAEDAEEDTHSLGKIEDAIAMATSSVGLMPGVAFQARVAQLSQLSLAHNTVSHFVIFSGFSHHLGSPEWYWISFFHFVLSSASFSVLTPPFPYLFYTSLYTWFSVFLSVSFLVLVHIIFLVSALHPFSYHFSLFSVIFIVTVSCHHTGLWLLFLILKFTPVTEKIV